MTPEALRRRMAHGNIYPPEKVDAALGELLPGRQPLRAARAGPAVGGRPRRRGTPALPRRARHRPAVGGPRADRGRRSPGGPEGETLLRRAARIAAGRPGAELLAVHVVSGRRPGRRRPDRARAGNGALVGVDGRLVAPGGRGRRRRRAARLRPRRERHPDRAGGEQPRPRRGLPGAVGASAGSTRLSGEDRRPPRHRTRQRRRPGARRCRSRGLRTALSRAGGCMAAGRSRSLGCRCSPRAVARLRGDAEPASGILLYLARGGRRGARRRPLAGAGRRGRGQPAARTTTSRRRCTRSPSPRPRTTRWRCSSSSVVAAPWSGAGRPGRPADDEAAGHRPRPRPWPAWRAASCAVRPRFLSSSSRSRETFGLTSVSLLERAGRHGRSEPRSAEVAPSTGRPGRPTLPVGDNLMLVLAGDRRRDPTGAADGLRGPGRGGPRARRAAGRGGRGRPVVAEANELRTALLAAVSHDLRSRSRRPRRAVTSLRSDGVEWTQEARRAPRDRRRVARPARRASIENLLDMSRLEAGALRRQPGAGGPRGAGAAGARRARRRARHGRSSTCPRRCPEASADAALLERVAGQPARQRPAVQPDRQAVRCRRELARRARRDPRSSTAGPASRASSGSACSRPFQRLGDRDTSARASGSAWRCRRGLTTAMGGS